ncbi:MAG: metallophosphoesterase [Anaerolineae bacterium]|nr:metallophosphoesterase [Anaerolineae bacterium]
MSQKSYSFNGVKWDSNAELVDWQCGRCRAHFSAKEDGIQHISTEHKEGTLYPRLNTSGRLRLAEFLPVILSMTKNEVLDMLAKDEPSVLESLGFRAEVVKEPTSNTQTVEETMTEAPNIPPELYRDLQAALLRCGPFQSDSTLRPLFVDSRISAWRDDLPSADSASKRVQAVIDYLLPKFNDSGDNALVLLILVIRDQTPRGDACRGRLDALAKDLNATYQCLEVGTTDTQPLFKRLQQLLLTCNEFQNPNILNAVMESRDLIAWRPDLPIADTVEKRVELVINYLSEKRRSDGESALALLLQVLAERQTQGQCHRELLELANELRGKVPPPRHWPSNLTWLHLSDLHFRESRNYDETIVLKELLRDVAERIEEDNLRPDFIVVTGDIAFSGKPEEYQLAGSFFDKLLETTKLSRERLFVVPGNHDANRNLISNGAKAITNALVDRDNTNAILADTDDLKSVMKRFRGYAEFVNSYFGGHGNFNDKQYFYVRSLISPGPRVMLLGLNSAWVCTSDNDKTPGVLVGERQARAALEMAESGDLKIALLHHPFDWLREFDQNDSAAMLLDGCDFILHGHLHRMAATQLSGPDTSAMVIGGGACYETRQYPNMYNFVRLDMRTGTGTVYLRRYFDERGGFWAPGVGIYRNAPDGVYEFQIPQKKP